MRQIQRKERKRGLRAVGFRENVEMVSRVTYNHGIIMIIVHDLQGRVVVNCFFLGSDALGKAIGA